MNSALSALMVTSSLVLAGCGVVQVNSGRVSQGGPASGSAEPGQASRTGTDLAARAKQTYDAWTFETCSISSCDLQFARESGVMPDGQRGGALTNPKPGMANPDPEWLPGWDALPSDESGARVVWKALADAASYKSWASRCHDGYLAHKKALDERIADAGNRIRAASALQEPLDRIGALLSLPTRSTGAPTKEWEFAPGFDAAAYDSEIALIEELRRQGKLWVLAAERKNLSPNAVEILAPRWDAALEERAFCRVAANEGIGTVKRWPDLTRPHDPKFVRPVFTRADLDQLAQARSARKSSAAAALSIEDPKGPKNPQQFQMRQDDKLVSFAVQGKTATIKLHRHTEYGSSIGQTCVDGRGRVGACPTMNVKKDEYTTVVVADWPSGIKLEQGDRVSYFGEITSSNIQGKGTPIEKWTQEHRADHVFSIARKDGTRLSWW